MSKKDKSFFETLTVSVDNTDVEPTITLGEIDEDGEPRPNHYSQDPNSVECIEIIKQLCKEHQNDPFTDYNRYQAFKYLWRMGKKDDVLFDLNKAITFLEFARKALEDERNG